MKKCMVSIGLCLLLILGIGIAVRAQVPAPGLLSLPEFSNPAAEIPVIVTLSDKVDVGAFTDVDKEVRRAELIQALQDKAIVSQAALDALAGSLGAKNITRLWIINGMALTARPGVIQAIAKLPGIESIRLDEAIPGPDSGSGFEAPAEWNIQAIRASDLWNYGFTGQGVVVAVVDTGVDPYHPDLQGRYRGGSNSWFDPNGEHAVPYDAHGHGTRVAGLVVGGDAGGSSIGAAPGAQWIGVKIFNDAGYATLSGIHQGFQWLLDPDGDPYTADAPHVVNNSWSFLGETNHCITEFQYDVGVLKAAGIAVVFSAGNEGPALYTSVSPANYAESFSVGSVDASLTVSGFSSRGPSACHEGVFPGVTAPGEGVRTSDRTFGGVFPDSYAYVSGTSFSAPHVAGVMALLLSAFPATGVSRLEQAIEQSALDLGPAGPDTAYGYGLIDVMGAYARLNEGPLCTDADGDGFYAEADCGGIQDCDDGDPSVYPGALEIKHDGVDQDCNGYDLTIDILTAAYTAKQDTVSVEASSALGQGAALRLEGYGPMKWNKKSLTWSIQVRKVGSNPGTVTVSGLEGSETAVTTAK